MVPATVAQANAFRKPIELHAELLFEETGEVLRAGADAHPIEPFGFRDGISQPVFYQSHLDFWLKLQKAAAAQSDLKWNPAATLNLVLCADPNGKQPWSCGSYFVFRKLEQDVNKFYKQSTALAAGKRWAPEELRERFVGRKKNGDTLFGPEGNLNDFDYSAAPAGDACPFHAHVRKSNPRSDLLPSYNANLNRIVRRGMPYGPRIKRDPDGTPNPVDPVQFEEGQKPGPVGILFMCAQSDIANQFEHLQSKWADKPDHPIAQPSAIDTVIGRLGPREKNRVPIAYKPPASQGGDVKDVLTDVVQDYHPVVQFKGGGYFFAPSLSFLRSLIGDWIART